MAYFYAQEGSRALSKISMLNPFSIQSQYFICENASIHCIYLYRSLGCLLYIFYGKFYIQPYFNWYQHWTLLLTLLKFIILLFWSNNLIISSKWLFQLLYYYRLCDLLSQKMKSIGYSIKKIFKRSLLRKVILHLFLRVDVLHRPIVGSGIISMLPIFHEKWLSLHSLLSIAKYLSRGLQILLCVRGEGGIHIY